METGFHHSPGQKAQAFESAPRSLHPLLSLLTLGPLLLFGSCAENEKNTEKNTEKSPKTMVKNRKVPQRFKKRSPQDSAPPQGACFHFTKEILEKELGVPFLPGNPGFQNSQCIWMPQIPEDEIRVIVKYYGEADWKSTKKIAQRPNFMGRWDKVEELGVQAELFSIIDKTLAAKPFGRKILVNRGGLQFSVGIVAEENLPSMSDKIHSITQVALQAGSEQSKE